MERGQILGAATALNLILAGKAVFTLVSKKSGTRYTYKVIRADSKKWNPATYFVSLLTGPDNTSNYQYIGMIQNNRFRTTQKSRMRDDSVPVKAISWSLIQLSAGKMSELLEIWHEGRCCRCGRRLTVPDSIAIGLGPECSGMNREGK